MEDSWAIVIGIDDYGDKEQTLVSAVGDAMGFARWLTQPGRLKRERVRLLLGPARDRHVPRERRATRDNLFRAINDVMAKSEGSAESLWFFYSGHGATAEWANREESALVFPAPDENHPVQTVAVRSLVEFFETTQFKDQFFFIDACRSPLKNAYSEIGPWQIPRRRDPGQDPAQQFILYSTSPGRPSEDATWPGTDTAFAGALMNGLGGDGVANAWSWERRRYEVRWERLAQYVKTKMEQQKSDLGEGYPFQVPQDVGTRGVAGRDRDALMALPHPETVKPVTLTLDLASAPSAADVTVEDALGVAVASAKQVTGLRAFDLLPRTYAAIAAAGGRTVRAPSPIELYDAATWKIEWQGEDEAAGEDPYAPGEIKLASRDPFAVADVRDGTGHVIDVTTRTSACLAPPGFYSVRLLAPEREQVGRPESVLLRGGAKLRPKLRARLPDARVAELAEDFGGSVSGDYVKPRPRASPAAWAQPSTVIAAAVGAALNDDRSVLQRLGCEKPLPADPDGSGVAFVAVCGNGAEDSLKNLRVRIWRAGDEIDDGDLHTLHPTPAGVASVVKPIKEAEPYWLSLEPERPEEDEPEVAPRDNEQPAVPPTVVALPLLKGRLAVVVGQVDSDRIRLYQYHPLAQADATTTPDALRRLEHLQRQLLGGRLDGAESIVAQVRKKAQSDPFGACLAGYVMLRLGRREGLGELASEIVDVARLSDGYILRGEYEAHVQNEDGMRQAFTDAVNTGIPAFGEGLTRLVEGLRASSFVHPRGALVRHIFQRHARGVMWSAFTPRRPLKPGRLVITGADVGFEG